MVPPHCQQGLTCAAGSIESSTQHASFNPTLLTGSPSAHSPPPRPPPCLTRAQTGFCSYGDSCKFMHDRGDYKMSWELDRVGAARLMVARVGSRGRRRASWSRVLALVVGGAHACWAVKAAAAGHSGGYVQRAPYACLPPGAVSTDANPPQHTSPCCFVRGRGGLRGAHPRMCAPSRPSCRAGLGGGAEAKGGGQDAGHAAERGQGQRRGG